MPKVICFKMPFKTNHFNQNQKVWVRMTTGAMAAFVNGKFRGKGRYVSAWVRWDKKSEGKCPEFKEISVDEGFALRHGLKTIL